MKKNKVFGVLLGGSLLLGSFGEVHSMLSTGGAASLGMWCGCPFGCLSAYYSTRYIEWVSDRRRQLNIAPPAVGEIPPPPGFVVPQLAEAPMAAPGAVPPPPGFVPQLAEGLLAADEAPLPDVEDVQDVQTN